MIHMYCIYGIYFGYETHFHTCVSFIPHDEFCQTWFYICVLLSLLNHAQPSFAQGPFHSKFIWFGQKTYFTHNFSMSITQFTLLSHSSEITCRFLERNCVPCTLFPAPKSNMNTLVSSLPGEKKWSVHTSKYTDKPRHAALKRVLSAPSFCHFCSPTSWAVQARLRQQTQKISLRRWDRETQRSKTSFPLLRRGQLCTSLLLHYTNIWTILNMQWAP